MDRCAGLSTSATAPTRCRSMDPSCLREQPELFVNGFEQVWGMIQGKNLKTSVKEYYNYTATSIPLLMSMCTGVYLFFRALGPWTAKLSPLWSIGRHSLGVYILHLILIALCTLVFGSMRPFENAFEINSAFLVIVLICYGYAFIKERTN